MDGSQLSLHFNLHNRRGSGQHLLQYTVWEQVLGFCSVPIFLQVCGLLAVSASCVYRLQPALSVWLLSGKSASLVLLSAKCWRDAWAVALTLMGNYSCIWTQSCHCGTSGLQQHCTGQCCCTALILGTWETAAVSRKSSRLMQPWVATFGESELLVQDFHSFGHFLISCCRWRGLACTCSLLLYRHGSVWIAWIHVVLIFRFHQCRQLERSFLSGSEHSFCLLAVFGIKLSYERVRSSVTVWVDNRAQAVWAVSFS